MNIQALLSLVTAVESIFYKKEKNRKVLQDDIPDRAGLTYIAYFFCTICSTSNKTDGEI